MKDEGLPVEEYSSEVEDSIKSIGVKIEAARSGRINGNLVLYTPKAMAQGVESFLTPFNKHLQSKHNGEAVGVIREAEHVLELFPNASDEFLDILERIREHSEASDGKELVKAVKELINTPEYNSAEYRGLGIATIYGDIYDPHIMAKLRARTEDIGTVSIGGKSREVYCSICSQRYTKAHDKVHKKGNYYNGELCFHINNDLYLDHCGFVPNPADKLTGTEVVADSQQLDITHYNSMENLMTLEDLRQKAKDPEAVKVLIGEYFTDEAVAKVAMEKYTASLKNSRANHHLLSEGNVLNLRTPVGVFVAEKLVNDFSDEDEDKSYLSEVIAKAKRTLGIENLDTALQEFLEEKKEEPEVVADSVQQEGLFEKLVAYFDTKLEELASKFHKVEDEQQKSALHEELKALRGNCEADEKVISALKADLAESLIDQIITLKGKVSDEYKAKLQGRSLDQLKLTLEDLKEASKLKETVTEVTEDLKKTSTTEVITAVEDAQQAVVEAPSVETPPETFSDLVKRVGLAQALKQSKKK